MVSRVREIRVAPRPLTDFEPILGAPRVAALTETLEGVAKRLEGRSLFTVTAEAWGGSVPENRRTLVQYARGSGVHARWFVIEGSQEFFALSAALRSAVQGAEIEPGLLSESARALYEKTLRENATELLASSRARDLVVLHDPATAGMIVPLVAAGLRVIWRCHHSTDASSDTKALAWDFLAPDLAAAHAFVFPRKSLAPPFCPRERLFVLPASIDPFAVKNRELGDDARRAILVHAGLLEPTDGPGPPTFERADGTPGRVESTPEIIRLGRPPSCEDRLVLQVARWDAEKDAVGVLDGFCLMLDEGDVPNVQLLLVGPDPDALSEGPRSRHVYERVCERWRALPHAVRQRAHIAALPLADVDEHAAILNALQRQSTVVVQKSLHEGVGLAVTEAMWKYRPVLVSGVGGLREQVEDGVSGVLLKDPSDPSEFASSLRALLEDPARAERLGRNAHERVAERYLDTNTLEAFAALLDRVDVD